MFIKHTSRNKFSFVKLTCSVVKNQILIYFAEEYNINHSLLLKIIIKMFSKGSELAFLPAQ